MIAVHMLRVLILKSGRSNMPSMVLTPPRLARKLAYLGAAMAVSVMRLQ
jgi:hypothetical protein